MATLKELLNKMIDKINCIPTKLSDLEADIDIGIQSDWDQNDETASDYVKNRPFYIKDPVEIKIADIIAESITWYKNSYFESGVHYVNLMQRTSSSFSCNSADFIEGNSYTLTINNSTYNSTAFKATGGICLGNPYLISSSGGGVAGEDNGENFAFRPLSDTVCQLYLRTDELPNSIELSVSYGKREIVQLDEKYISYKPGLLINKDDIYEVRNPDGTITEKKAKGFGEIFNKHTNDNANSSTATGLRAHAEGKYCHAEGSNSHAEGEETHAYGSDSHSEGFLTFAASSDQHVQGRFNIIDIENKYNHIVGNGDFTGSWTSGRSNAHTLDWNGNAWFSGDVYVGSTSGTNRDEGSKKLQVESDNSLTTSDKTIVGAINELKAEIEALKAQLA